MDPNHISDQLTPEQLQYAAIVGSWWFALARKAVVTVIAYEFTLVMSRRLDRRAGHRQGFGAILSDIRDADSAGLGLYYGLRELGRCLFLTAIVFLA